jgi:putative glutamine amidotransferase
MKPLIGITMNLEVQKTRNLNILDQDYGKAVQQAGGIPIPVLSIDSSIPDLIKQLDGFVFSGGDDIHPKFYKEKPLKAAGLTISPDERTQFELKLFKAAYKAKKPILAICGGQQLINVALGGSLVQDIKTQIDSPILKHQVSKKGEKVFHEVEIEKGTRLSRILGASRIIVRSAHHQSVKNLGKGLLLSAQSKDWVVEAFEPKTNTFLIAVQWHPEKTLYDQYTKKLFKALIAASK